MSYNKEIAEGHLNELLTKYSIKVAKYSKSSCGWADWKKREVKIPDPTDVDRFCVCLHEVKHIIDGDLGYRFEQEFACDLYALREAEKLGFDTTDWKIRMRWHSLSRIAMATNRRLPVSKIPSHIKEYFNDVDFTGWEGKKVFVGWNHKGDNKITISIK